jgi:epsin
MVWCILFTFSVDEKMKDQGLNVRNRAKEIAELIGDNSRVRDERRKAKENKQKYTGASSSVESGGGGFGSSNGGFGGSGKKYGGFGPSDYSSGGGSGGGASSSNGSRFRDEVDDSPPRRANSNDRIQIVMKNESVPKKAVVADVPNLMDMESTITDTIASSSVSKQEDEWGDFTSPSVAPVVNKISPLDDFAEFQSSIPAATSMFIVF